ncbi:hypothetical protein KSS87_013241 [Heliosperma pusillum]|nr:hypothetical protein KSS87_013241 [Heliosperma pusillum]
MASLPQRDHFINLAKLAEQAERYDEMVDAMTKLAKLNIDLTVEERNLLSIGYKIVVGSRRASWRILSSIEHKEETRGNEVNVKHIRDYRRKVEAELDDVCGDVLSVIDDHLLPFSSNSESTAFYYKILPVKGLYHGCIYNLLSSNFRKFTILELLAAHRLCKGAQQIVKELKSFLKELNKQAIATTTAEAELPSTHPIRLGLALNFSIFYHEIMNSPERAWSLAKKAFDEAIPELDSLSEDSYKDSTMVLQVLRDILSLWTTDLSDDEDVLTSWTTDNPGRRFEKCKFSNIRTGSVGCDWFRWHDRTQMEWQKDVINKLILEKRLLKCEVDILGRDIQSIKEERKKLEHEIEKMNAQCSIGSHGSWNHCILLNILVHELIEVAMYDLGS